MNPKRVKTTIGDIFEADLGNGYKKCFQFVARDLTQLNADVICVFKHNYPLQVSIDIHSIVNEPIDFYSHVIVKFGVKLELWNKIGHNPQVNIKNALFRDSMDYGDPSIIISNNWRVWIINKKQLYVGRLTGKYRKADIGAVFPPEMVLHKMRTGEYDFVYPGFK